MNDGQWRSNESFGRWYYTSGDLGKICRLPLPTEFLYPIKNVRSCISRSKNGDLHRSAWSENDEEGQRARTIKDLREAVAYLRFLYCPEVRGVYGLRYVPTARSRDGNKSVFDSIFSSGDAANSSPNYDSQDCDRYFDYNENLEMLRSDEFEYGYAIRWLTALVSCAEDENEEESDEDEKGLEESHRCSGRRIEEDKVEDDVASIQEKIKEKEELLSEAAALIAICAGTAASGRLTRTFTFGKPQTSKTPHLMHISTSSAIELHLSDVPLENGDYESVGSQTWGSACVLAELLVAHPEHFFDRRPSIATNPQASVQPRSNDAQARSSICMEPITVNKGEFRVLELGSGTGLVGLIIAKLSHANNCDIISHNLEGIRKVEVYLTDFYPTVIDNLRSNAKANFSSSAFVHPLQASSAMPINVCVDVVRLDWETFSRKDSDAEAEKARAVDELGGGLFDLVVGADIIYEEPHAEWIKACLERLLSRHPKAYFHLVVPLRHTHTYESNTIERVFGRVDTMREGYVTNNICMASAEKKGTKREQLVILHEERFICDAQRRNHTRVSGFQTMTDSVHEVEYAYFQIGWSASTS